MTALTDVTVAQLEPGDRMATDSPFGEQVGIFVQRCPHPIWPALEMVIWRMSDGTWMHDALDARQVLPGAVDRPETHTEREARLRTAILNA